MNPVEPVHRTLEIEDKTNLLLVHPISNSLVPVLAKLGVSPNTISVTGLACGIIAGLLYNRYGSPLCCVFGFMLMICWHVMDGVDGQLARLTNTQSNLGKVLDGVCDYVTFTAVYIGLALPLSCHYGSWVWLVVAVSGACHAVQSASYELQRQDYDDFAGGRNSRAAAEPDDKVPQPQSAISQAAKVLDRLYIGMQLFATGVDRSHRDQMAAMFAPVQHRAARRQLYGQIFAQHVQKWSLMSANYRTIAIFVFAIIGCPLYYFFWEIIPLTLLMILLLSGQRSRYATFFDGARAATQTKA